MRLGHLSLHSIDIFRCLTRELSNIDDLQPTELYPVRDQVDRANTLRLQALPGKIYEFHAEDKGILSMLKGLLATETVRLKRGAQVMLLKNLDKHLVNGSMGVIVGFLGDNEYSTPEQIQQLVPPGNSAKGKMVL
ncbi:hypothetical protein BDF14DRAFT_265501 [Spinellus fusiger]|nr:hypothetical protein BDF14DRAFT_265501 [Spinellus fusiger]